MEVIPAVTGLMFYTLVVVAVAGAYNLPLLALTLVFRRRLGALAPRIIVAAGFFAAAWLFLYRLEWFDVWRHGWPGGRQLAIYLALAGAAGAVGWASGSLVAVKPERRVELTTRRVTRTA